MSTWEIMRWLYRRLPAQLRIRILTFYGKRAVQLLNHYSTTIIANAGRGQSSATSRRAPRSASEDQRISILTSTFFDFEGNDILYGGAERYLIELVRVIRELGYEPEVYQCANGTWVRQYLDMCVKGVDTGGDPQLLNQQFHALVPEGILTIYFVFHLAAPRCHAKSIGISHGIYWDHAMFQTIPAVQQQKLEEILTALANLERVVSVDTNTINWVRSTRVNLAQKFAYIPNFVDLKQFQPPKHSAVGQHNRPLVILYPRRLYARRGFWLVAEVVPDLIEKYPLVEFHLVGKADPAEQSAVQELMERYPGRVRWYFLPPERMHEAYQRADITIIPTIHSEGTSLSCLEALASGNAVVATHVGGLPNLILPGYNGLLIEPQTSVLRDALEQLVQDESLRLRLGERGRQVAQSFSLEHWRAQWKQLLEKYLIEAATPSA